MDIFDDKVSLNAGVANHTRGGYNVTRIRIREKLFGDKFWEKLRVYALLAGKEVAEKTLYLAVS